MWKFSRVAFWVTNYTNFDEFGRTLVALLVNSSKFVQFVTDVNGYKLSSF
jgi:hypothetical protein